jgi:hypothetical protein
LGIDVAAALAGGVAMCYELSMALAMKALFFDVFGTLVGELR